MGEQLSHLLCWKSNLGRYESSGTILTEHEKNIIVLRGYLYFLIRIFLLTYILLSLRYITVYVYTINTLILNAVKVTDTYIIACPFRDDYMTLTKSKGSIICPWRTPTRSSYYKLSIYPKTGLSTIENMWQNNKNRDSETVVRNFVKLENMII